MQFMWDTVFEASKPFGTFKNFSSYFFHRWHLKVSSFLKRDLRRIFMRCSGSVGVLCDDLQKGWDAVQREILTETSSHSGPVLAFTLLVRQMSSWVHAEVRKILAFAKHKRTMPLGGEIFHFLRHFLMTSDRRWAKLIAYLTTVHLVDANKVGIKNPCGPS